MLAVVNGFRRLCAAAVCTLLVVLAAALPYPASAQGGPPAQGQDQSPPAPPQDQPPATQAPDQSQVAQGPNRTPAPQQTPISTEQLEQILAPIALYPDNLLAQVLTASTYPLEVVRAARWTKDNPNVKGEALDQAMLKQPWDPSVKGLTAIPQVLQMMSDQLDWMEQLGEAFLAQPDDVSKTIQKLRARAEATGNLKSSQEIKVKKVKVPQPAPPAGGPGPVAVAEEPEYIEIEPATPDVVYVPVYDPVVVYGPWPYPAYRPFFWRPRGYVYAGVFGFGAAFVVGPALWTYYDWRHRRVWIDVRRYNRFNRTRLIGPPVRWQHNPAHRRSVPYRNVTLQQRFNKDKVTPNALRGTTTVKGRGTPAGTAATSKPATPKAPKGAAAVKRGAPGATKPVTSRGATPKSTGSLTPHKPAAATPSRSSRPAATSAPAHRNVARPAASAAGRKSPPQQNDPKKKRQH